MENNKSNFNFDLETNTNMSKLSNLQQLPDATNRKQEGNPFESMREKNASSNSIRNTNANLNFGAENKDINKLDFFDDNLSVLTKIPVNPNNPDSSYMMNNHNNINNNPFGGPNKINANPFNNNPFGNIANKNNNNVHQSSSLGPVIPRNTLNAGLNNNTQLVKKESSISNNINSRIEYNKRVSTINSNNLQHTETDNNYELTNMDFLNNNDNEKNENNNNDKNVNNVNNNVNESDFNILDPECSMFNDFNNDQSLRQSYNYMNNNNNNNFEVNENYLKNKESSRIHESFPIVMESNREAKVNNNAPFQYNKNKDKKNNEEFDLFDNFSNINISNNNRKPNNMGTESNLNKNKINDLFNNNNSNTNNKNTRLGETPIQTEPINFSNNENNKYSQFDEIFNRLDTYKDTKDNKDNKDKDGKEDDNLKKTLSELTPLYPVPGTMIKNNASINKVKIEQSSVNESKSNIKNIQEFQTFNHVNNSINNNSRLQTLNDQLASGRLETKQSISNNNKNNNNNVINSSNIRDSNFSNNHNNNNNFNFSNFKADNKPLKSYANINNSNNTNTKISKVELDSLNVPVVPGSFMSKNDKPQYNDNQNDDRNSDKSNDTAPIEVDLEEVNINFNDLESYKNKKVTNNKSNDMFNDFNANDFDFERKSKINSKNNITDNNNAMKNIQQKAIYSTSNNNNNTNINHISDINSSAKPNFNIDDIDEGDYLDNNKNVNKENEVINTSIMDMGGFDIAHLNNLVKQNNQPEDTKKIAEPQIKAVVKSNRSNNNNANKDLMVSNAFAQPKVSKDLIKDNLKQSSNLFNSNTFNNNNNVNNFKREPLLFHLNEYEAPFGQFPAYLKNTTQVSKHEKLFEQLQKPPKSALSNSENLNQCFDFLKKTLKDSFFQSLETFDQETLLAEITILFEDEKSNNTMQFESHILNISSLDKNILINNEIISVIKNLNQSVFDPNKNKIASNNQFLKNVCFDYYREVLNDGNSFYRSFIFKYLENCIITNNLFRVRRLFYDVYNSIIKNSSKVINRLDNTKIKIENKETVTVFFYYLLEFMQQGKIESTYEYFIKAFCSLLEISKTLIAYLRYSLAKFFKENQNSLFSFDFDYFSQTVEQKELINTNSNKIDLLPEMFLTDAGYNFDAFIKYYLLIDKTEPYPFIIAITAFLFEIDIEIFYYKDNISDIIFYSSCRNTENNYNNEQSMQFPPITLIKNESYSSTNLSSKSILLGNLGYNISYETGFSSAFKIKTPDNSPIYFSSYNYNDINTIDNEIDEFVDLKGLNKCQYCSEMKENSYKRFADYNDVIVCGDCIMNIVSKACAIRFSQLAKEKYFNIECK